MRGDVIIVEEHHRRAAKQIAASLDAAIKACPRRYTISVAGESGSGKSETAKALAEALGDRGVTCGVLQQDDYFVLPPKSNDKRRREDIAWVGIDEVRLDLLDAHLEQARAGAEALIKPLVIYQEDRIAEESMVLEGVAVVIAEGTYTTLLDNIDARVFIARDRLETMAARRNRAREAMEPFIEEVLKIEHEIISAHKIRADVVISKDYDVELVSASS